MTVSVIICTRNRPHDLVACLSCLKKQTLLPTELILIEDTSDQKNFSLQRLRKFFQDTLIHSTYISTKTQRIAASRNLGIIHATGTILVCLDDDVIFGKDLIQKFVQLHQKYPQAVGFLGKVLPLHHDVFSQFGSWYTTGKLLEQKRMCIVPHYASTAYSLVRKKILRHKLNYREDLKTGEDIDFFLRLYKKKERMYFHPSLSIQHKFRRTMWSLGKQHFEYAQNFTQLAEMYPQHFSVSEYFPTKKKQWLCLPYFFLKKSYEHAKYLILDGEMKDHLFWPAFVAYLAEFLGVYFSPKGRNLLLQNFKTTWL